jgi:hypothetical protein
VRMAMRLQYEGRYRQRGPSRAADSSVLFCDLLRTRPYLKARRFNTTTERSGLLPSRLRSGTKEISRRRLTLRSRSNGTIAAAWHDPIAFGARAKCCHFRARCVLPEAINTMANKTSPFDHDTIDSAPQFYSRIGSS